MTRRTPHPGWVLVLARRFARSRQLRASSATVGVVVGFVVAMFVVMNGLSLSGEQRAWRELDSFQAKVLTTTSVPAGDAAVVADFRSALDRGGFGTAEVRLVAGNVPLPQRWTTNVTLREGAWSPASTAGHYVLEAGRWPRAPGEVVLTEPTDPGVLGQTLGVFSGRAPLRVVGLADDRFATTPTLLAAPGTWAGLPADLERTFPDATAQVSVRWDGTRTEVLEALVAEVARRHRGAVQDANTRAGVLSSSEPYWLARNPAGYLLPVTVLPAAAVGLMLALNRRRWRDALGVAAAVGVPRAAGAAALMLAAGWWCLVAGAVGAAAGTGVGLAVSAVTAQLRGKESGPLANLGDPALRVAAGLGVGLVVLGLVLARGGARGDAASEGRSRSAEPAESRPDRRAGRLLRDGRQLAAVASSGAAVWLAGAVSSPATATAVAAALTAAVLLALPEIIAAVLFVLPQGGVRSRLAVRRLRADALQLAVGVGLLTVLLGGSTGFLTLLNTSIKTVSADLYPEVLPGQVLLRDPVTIVLPAPPAVIRVVDQALPAGTPSPVQLQRTAQGLSSDVPTESIVVGSYGLLLAVASIGDAERALGTSLTAVERSTLDRGGVLLWADRGLSSSIASGQVQLSTQRGDAVLARWSAPAREVSAPPVGWRDGTDGLVLAPQADSGFVTSPGPVLYTGVDPDVSYAAQAAVEAAGLDPRAVFRDADDPPAVPPAALVVTALGLALVTLVGATLAARGSVRALSGYRQTLLAVGLPPRWIMQVLGIQQLVTVALATALALVISIPPVVALGLSRYGFVVAIPVGQIAVLLLAVYASCALALLWARRTAGTPSAP